MRIISTEKITVFTDTASSITQEEGSRRGIGLIPVEIIIDHGSQIESFNDFTLPPEKLYQILGKKRITTTAPNPEEISKVFEKYYDLGGRKFLFIALSSKNSSIYGNTYVASREFRETHPDSIIEVIDSKSLCLAQSFKVDKALELVESGFPLEDIKTRVNEINKKIVLYCSGNNKTAKFIYNSGRVHGKDRFKAFAASAISQFKVPFLTMNPNDGSISARIISGGEEEGIKEIVENLYNECQTRKQQPNKIAVAYTQDEEIGSRVIYLLSRRFDLTKSNLIKPKEAGSALAVHAGPRVAVLSAIWS